MIPKHVLPIEELQVVGIGTEPPKNSVFSTQF